MKIVFSLNQYKNLTGSELYIYELARVLKKRGHSPCIISNTGFGLLLDQTQRLEIPVYNFFDHPALTPDVVHTSQALATAYSLRFFSDKPLVTTIHSEFSYEKPIVHPHIMKYIAVRPTIENMYSNLPIKTIYNGVDFTRFNTLKTTDQNPQSVLFVGTFDQLRQKALYDIQLRAAKDNKELVVVSPDIKELKQDVGKHIRYVPALFDVEKWVKYCGETAGVMMGRTTIEGWACGKPGWIYDIDEDGNIKDIAVADPPKDMKQFDIEYMADRVIETYEEVIH